MFASLGLFVTLFLPWYQETVIARGTTTLQNLSESLTGWGAFSFVEAAVLLVAVGVIALLFVRAEGRPFRVPFGDGAVITAGRVLDLRAGRLANLRQAGHEQSRPAGHDLGHRMGHLRRAGRRGVSRLRRLTYSRDHRARGPAHRPGRLTPRRLIAAPAAASGRPGRGARAGAPGAARRQTAARDRAAEETAPRRQRVQQPDPDLFESVETEWPERPTEPRLTRRRMTDEERATEPGPSSSPPPAGGDAHPGAGDDTRPTEATPGGEPRTRQMTTPSTPAARRAREADDQLTIPLDRED